MIIIIIMMMIHEIGVSMSKMKPPNCELKGLKGRLTNTTVVIRGTISLSIKTYFGATINLDNGDLPLLIASQIIKSIKLFK